MIDMEDNSPDNPPSGELEFRIPDQPAPRAETSTKGGKRIGAGRKRVYEEGYANIRNGIWKSISVHREVYEEWQQERTARGITSNTDFARYLLKNLKSNQGTTTTTTSQAHALSAVSPSSPTSQFPGEETG